MRPVQALKSRIEKESKHKQVEGKPSLLDTLQRRNREIELRRQRRSLLRRTGVR